MLELNELSRALFEDWGFDQAEAWETAQRFRRYLEEYTPEEEIPFNFTTFTAETKQLIICRDMEFSSICKHHLLPFFGIAHVGYVPNLQQVGLSKIPRLVNWCAKRPQTQEDLTGMISRELRTRLNPQGVMVVLKSTHTCMSCRGVQKVGASMITSLPSGVFYNNPITRQEFLELIK